jgi:hypothetical protein
MYTSSRCRGGDSVAGDFIQIIVGDIRAESWRHVPLAWVLAGFEPQWPVLKIAVAGFRRSPSGGPSRPWRSRVFWSDQFCTDSKGAEEEYAIMAGNGPNPGAGEFDL